MCVDGARARGGKGVREKYSGGVRAGVEWRAGGWDGEGRGSCGAG